MMGKNRWAGIAAILAGVACLFFLKARATDGSEPEALRVLLITMDTTRADHLGLAGFRAGGRSPTPHLDALAEKGRVYPDAFAPVPLTLPSHATILTGLSPGEHGLRENDAFKLPPMEERSFKTVPEELGPRGYECSAVVSARPLDAMFGLDQGFARYHDVSGDEQGGRLSLPDRGAVETTDLAIREVERLSQSDKSFLWVHYFDPHHPHRQHSGHAGQVAAASSPYAGEIAFMDEQIGRLLAAVREKWGDERTLILAVGDHGEGLGEHGEETHGHLIHDATLRVPFIVKPPHGVDLAPAGRMVELADVAPTILGLTGGEDRGERSTGGVSKGAIAHEEIYAECVRPYRQFGWAALHSIRDATFKLVQGGGVTELYAWHDDPGELTDLSESRPDDAARLSRRLVSFRQRHTTLLKADPRSRGTNAIIASGYMGGPSADVPAEPTAEENATLPHPRSRLFVVDLLDALRLELDRGARTRGDESRAHFELARQHVTRLDEASDSCPVTLFWCGRAWFQLQASSLDFQVSTRVRLLRRSAGKFDELLTMRPLDHRAHNMLLKIQLSLHAETGDASELRLLLNRAEAQRRAGLADGLTFALEGLAHEAVGDIEKAHERLLEATKRSPGNSSFRRDRDRLRALLRSER